MKSYKDRVFHVISNTHWDREWRFPFQRNRQMLVDMIDDVLKILQEYPDYHAFHLDSQSVVLEDYFEIRPEKKALVTELVKQKRLFIGPWYILPDEFLVGGENLIRNLLLGHKICAQYGNASKIGYSPFSWGQISQLPQLYREFGVELIMFYRGVNSLDSHNAEFIWVGADGEESLASRFSTAPRYNFYFFIYRPIVHNETPYDVAEKWERGGTPFHFASHPLEHEDYFTVQPADEFYAENVPAAVTDIVNRQVEDFTTPHVIWMEGHDSSGPNAKTVKIIQEIRKAFPDMDVRHSTLEDYAAALKECADFKNLPKVYGERRSAQYDLRSGNLYGYVTSARMYLKLKNFEAEKWLQYYAEPWVQLARMFGADISQQYINIAWKHLLQNSAHDSIGGCSLDEIHEDMMARYKQTIEIAHGVYERALKFFINKINSASIPGSNKSSIYLTVFNPLPHLRNGYQRFTIDIPRNIDKGSVRLKTPDGKLVPLKVLKNEVKDVVLEQLIDRPMYYEMQRFEVEAMLPQIPALGYQVFVVEPVKPKQKELTKIARMENNTIHAENKYYRISFNEDGTFNLYSKKDKNTFNYLGYLFDEGDAGHAWVLKSVQPTVTTLGTKPTINITSNSELSAEITVIHKMQLPKRKGLLSKHAGNTVTVKMNIIIEKDTPHVRLSLVVDNNAENHRLRIMFPTGITADSHFAEGQFDVVERSNLRPDTTNWVEQPMYDFPAHHFIDIHGVKGKKSAGLAIFNNGLKEYECIPEHENTLALTLLRAFSYVIHPSAKEDYTHQPGAQCLGKMQVELAILPHAKKWKESELLSKAMDFSYPLTGVQSGISNGNMPINQSFIEIDNPLVSYSSIKQSEDGAGYILRLYNPSTQSQTANVNFALPIKKITKVTLEEIETDEIRKSKSSFKITIKPKKIVSVKFYC